MFFFLCFFKGGRGREFGECQTPLLYLQQHPKEVTITWQFWDTTSEPTLLWNMYKSGIKITMPIKIQILSHILRNRLFLLSTPTKVAANTTVLPPNFYRILFSAGSVWEGKLLSLRTTTRYGILAEELMYKITVILGLNCALLWFPFVFFCLVHFNSYAFVEWRCILFYANVLR